MKEKKRVDARRTNEKRMTRFFSFLAKGGRRATSAALMSMSSSSSFSSSLCARNKNDVLVVGRARILFLRAAAATAAARSSSSSSSNFSRRSFFFFEGGGGGGGGKSDVVGATTSSTSSSSSGGRVNGSNSSISVSSRHFSGEKQQQQQQQQREKEEREEEEDTLHLSEKCEDQLRSIFLKEMEKGGGEGVLERKTILRIGVDGGGCAGFQYTFALVDEKDVKDASGDRVFRGRKFPEEAKVVCDEVSFAYLKGSTVDYAEEMIRSAFEVVKNPNAEQKCGCGVSFEAKF